jgi:hypothetical protein
VSVTYRRVLLLHYIAVILLWSEDTTHDFFPSLILGPNICGQSYSYSKQYDSKYVSCFVVCQKTDVVNTTYPAAFTSQLPQTILNMFSSVSEEVVAL